jgi:serine/threonine protein kinase
MTMASWSGFLAWLGRPLSIRERPAASNGSLPLSERVLLNQIRHDFEDDLRKGLHPRIEDRLDKSSGPERLDLLLQLLEVELIYRREIGECPTPDEYKRRFPEDEALIDRVFSDLTPPAPIPSPPPSSTPSPSQEGLPNPIDAPPSPEPNPPRGAGPAYIDLTTIFVVSTVAGQVGPPVGVVGHEQLKAVFSTGKVIEGRYVLEGELGRGGMGQVYLGLDLRLNRKVAIKVILPHRQPGLMIDNATPKDRWREEALVEEAITGARLEHPAIATVYDFGFHEGKPYTVFEHLPGKTLQEVLKERDRLPIEEVRLIIGPLAQALEFAHGHQVVHRDLKPANIKATSQGQFKILDLGLAAEFRRVGGQGFAGTPAYAAPEQFTGLPIDGRSDQYALALIAYEMLAGHRLFRYLDFEALQSFHSSKQALARIELPGLPDPVSDALYQALNPDANERFVSCEAFATALGCQLLSTPASLPEILQEMDIEEMDGRWTSYSLFPRHVVNVLAFTLLVSVAALIRSSGPILVLIARAKLPRSRPVHLALASNAIWIVNRADLVRLPIAAIAELWGKGKNLRIRLRGVSADNYQRFRMNSSEDCRAWLEQIRYLHGQHSSTAREMILEPRSEPVVLLRERPSGRLQILGNMEAEARGRRSAQASLQIRGALIGADAIANVREEKVSKFNRTVWCLSGTAMRAVDHAGKLELRSRWFSDEAARIGGWMLVIIFTGLVVFLLDPVPVPALEYSTIADTQYGEGLFMSLILEIILLYGWPFIVSILLRGYPVTLNYRKLLSSQEVNRTHQH